MRDTTAALTHGDFYRGDIRCTNGDIRAVFDWDDARYWSLEHELAWSVWEFTQSDADATLDIVRAVRFLDAYAGANGPVPLGDRSFIVPLIRHGLRREVRDAAARGELGLAFDAHYIARASAAFHQLSEVGL
jgi:aminoglycoside phosphotransferase (APT) family kinase protein